MSMPAANKENFIVQFNGADRNIVIEKEKEASSRVKDLTEILKRENIITESKTDITSYSISFYLSIMLSNILENKKINVFELAFDLIEQYEHLNLDNYISALKILIEYKNFKANLYEKAI